MAGHVTDGTTPTLGRRVAPSDHAIDRSIVRHGVKALLSSGDRVLLVEERRADGSTFWTLPGGGLRPGESYVAGLQRELAEELGCGVELSTPVGNCVYRHETTPDTATVYEVFDGTLVGDPSPNRAESIIGHRWVRPGDAPRSTLAPFRRLIDELAGDDQ